jgi:hypothetical protein
MILRFDLRTRLFVNNFLNIHMMFLGTDNIQLIGSLATIPRASLHTPRVTRVMPPTSHPRPRRRFASLMEFTTVRPQM